MKTSSKIITSLASVASLTALAQSSLNTQPGDSRVPPPAGAEAQKTLPGDQGFVDIDMQIKKSQEALKQTLGTATEVDASKVTAEPSKPVEAVPAQAQAMPAPKPKRVFKSKPIAPTEPAAEVYLPQNGTTVFNNNLNSEWAEETIILPGLSAAYATILFGEEVASTSKDWIAARLDYAFLGPNGTVIELNGCRAEISISANFNSAKVKGEIQKIVCRAKDGKVFTTAATGKMISAVSEYGGVESEYIMSGPARGIALEAIQTITKGVGGAIAAAQVTESGVSSQFNTSNIRNVTGDKDKYVAGKALEASGEFMQYAIDFYKGLEPTLAVAPGTKVHLMIKDSLEIPKEYFTRKIDIQHLEKDLKR
jgi:hypothetical protein